MEVTNYLLTGMTLQVDHLSLIFMKNTAKVGMRNPSKKQWFHKGLASQDLKM